MRIISRIFTSKEIKITIEAINEAEKVLDNSSFNLIRDQIDKAVQHHQKKIIKLIKKGTTPTELAYIYVSNISGNYLESGHFHLYRGLLVGSGKELLKLFDDSTDKLVEIGAIEETFAKQQKQGIRDSISQMG